MILEVISLPAKMNAIPLLRAKSFGFVLLDGIECKEALLRLKEGNKDG